MVVASHRQPVVEVRDLYKAYRRGGTVAPVLNGVNLTVHRGQCVYLAGPSGSGKTTLLSIIACILSPDRGTVRILGHDVAALHPLQRTLLRRDQIGFVFQKFHLIRGLTAVHNVCVPLTLRGVSQREARRKASEILHIVGLGDRLDHYPHNLSAGQCQRVAFARALVNDPELILADEPTASLDAVNGQEVMDLLRRLVIQQNKTAIVVTHDQRIFSFADRIFWLDNGRLTKGPTSELAAPGRRGGTR